MKKSWSKFPLIKQLSIGLIVIGVGCMSWALFNIWSQPDYSIDILDSHYLIPDTFDDELNKLTKGYTGALGLNPSPVLEAPDKAIYPSNPKEGDEMGSLTMPALNQRIPIIQGTSLKSLKKGVGHFTQSVFPGREDNCVLSGHNDTVFNLLGNLQIGDLLIVETWAGIFTYEVDETKIVDEDDRTVIVPTESAVLTLTTCYPFNTIGYTSERYIVSASLVRN